MVISTISVRHPPPEEKVSAADRQITSLARRQHGAVSARQLRAIGVSLTAVRRRLADGRLCPVYRGLYAIGPLTQRGRWMAAVLAVGPQAVLSHRDAASLHGLRATSRATIEVTVARRRAVARALRSTKRATSNGAAGLSLV